MKYKIVEFTASGDKYFKIQMKKYLFIWFDIGFYWNEIFRPYIFTSRDHAQSRIDCWLDEGL